MRALPLVLAGIAGVAIAEVAVNVVVRPQSGPPALGAAFEAHLLAIGALCGALAILLTLTERGRGASAVRVVGIGVLVLAFVRLGGEWWSPDTATGSTGGAGPTTGAGDQATIPVRVSSWNLATGSKAPDETVAALLDVPADERPDVVALQELTPGVAAALDADPGIDAAYPYRILEARKDIRGMGILSSLPLIRGVYGAFPMLLTATVLLPDGSRLDLVNAHPLPPRIQTIAGVPVGIDTRLRDVELESVRAAVDRASDPDRALLVGDLNATQFEPGFSIVAHDLADAHDQAGTGTGFTWRPSFLEPLHAGLLRIDHVLGGADIAPLAVTEDCSIPGDHCVLTADLAVARKQSP